MSQVCVFSQLVTYDFQLSNSPTVKETRWEIIQITIYGKEAELFDKKFSPIPNESNKKLYRRNVDSRHLRAQRHKAPQPGVLAHRLPLLADPGADGDKALVWDVPQYQQQHLVGQLLHVAGGLVLVAHPTLLLSYETI